MALQIRSEMKQLSPVERELSIVIPGDHVAKELDRAYKELSMKVRIKGFRPGKVPRYVLEQFYKGDTEQQVLERIVGQSFREAVKTHELEPVANPTIEGAGSLVPGMDFSFQAKVEVKPAIELKAWKGLKLHKTTYTAGDDDVQKELERLRERQARVVPIEGRDVVQQGDLVETNWSGTVEGEHVKGLSGVSFVVEVGGGVFYKEAEQALVGKKVGDSFTVDAKLPDDFRVESARGKSATLQMKVLTIKKKELPPLDDEFAKDVAEDIETLAQLKERIQTELTKVAAARSKAEVRDQAINAMIEQNPFDVPSALIERQAEQVAADRLSRLPQQQAEMIWASQGTRLKEDARPMAARQVRISLLLEELVKAENLKVTEAELEDQIEKMAAEIGTDVKTVKSVYKKGNRMAELEFQLATQKALDKVLETATYEEQQKPLNA